ncbi:hypothetical protein A3Q56_04657 [Intoshia linei]|uniref:LTD domain-containing protein n=1 Tax=Intoshia linei TaxID=1819745 RepID=A0A177B0B2_9BILA|nr:hypothetical protein A3Q56_04657 [Intoshia linei]
MEESEFSLKCFEIVNKLDSIENWLIDYEIEKKKRYNTDKNDSEHCEYVQNYIMYLRSILGAIERSKVSINVEFIDNELSQIESSYENAYKEFSNYYKKPDKGFIKSVQIIEIEKNGRFIRIINRSDTEAENINNYLICQVVNNVIIKTYRIKEKCNILPKMIVEIKPLILNDGLSTTNDCNNWCTENNCITILQDVNGLIVSWFKPIGLSTLIQENIRFDGIFSKIEIISKENKSYQKRLITKKTCATTKNSIPIIFRNKQKVKRSSKYLMEEKMTDNEQLNFKLSSQFNSKSDQEMLNLIITQIRNSV